MDLRIHHTSTVYVRTPVTATADPTSKPVSMAILPRDDDPEAADFETAGWEPGTGQARILIGPGSPTIGQLEPGIYRVWVKVDDNPEDPVIEATSSLVIYEVP